MSQGTLYGDTETRCILPVGLVKAFNLDVALEKRGADAHKAAFPNGKVPAFIGQHGYKLQESIAVIYYCTYTLWFLSISIPLASLHWVIFFLFFAQISFPREREKKWNAKLSWNFYIDFEND